VTQNGTGVADTVVAQNDANFSYYRNIRLPCLVEFHRTNYCSFRVQSEFFDGRRDLRGPESRVHARRQKASSRIQEL
jgi:hypothetical protein